MVNADTYCTTIPFTQGTELMAECFNRYMANPCVEARRGYAQRLSYGDEPDERLLSAEMFLELASSDELSCHTRDALFHDAVSQFGHIVTYGEAYDVNDRTQQQARLRLLGVGTLHAVHVAGQLPDLAALQEEYEAVVDFGESLFDGYDELSIPVRREVNGGISELSIWLPLARFAVHNEVEDYIPSFSLLSQDKGGDRRPFKVNRWDISVHTQVDRTQPPEINHKIQVKTAPSQRGKHQQYDPSITVVYYLRDMALRCHGMRMETMISECARELTGGNGSKAAGYRLTDRADKLLTMIDG